MSEQQIQYTRALVDLGGVGQRQSTMQELLDNTKLPVPFIASTEGVKADGINLKAKDWDLTRYAGYSPIMWVHNYWHPPLGTGKASLDGKKLRMGIRFDEADDFAMLIRGKAIKGMMAGSVGWMTTEDGKNELLEFSMTPMGLDPDALPDIKRMSPTALRAVSKMFEGEEDLEEAIKTLRDEIMGEMKQLLEDWLAADQDAARAEEDEDEIEPEEDEEDPEDDIRVLLPDVSGLEGDYMYYNGFVYVPSIVEDGITTWSTTIDGTPLPDNTSSVTWYDMSDLSITRANESPEEMLQRAGAVLSKKNRDDLSKALELIQSVIERATPDDEFFATLEDDRAQDIDDGREEEPETRQEPTPDVVNQIKQVLEEV